MPATTFMYLRKNFPEDFAQMARFELKVANFSRFRYMRKRKKRRTNIEKYGEQLAEILDWLDENCSEPYYPRLVKDQPLSWDTMVEFYFTDDTDAMAFRLMFE